MFFPRRKKKETDRVVAGAREVAAASRDLFFEDYQMLTDCKAQKHWELFVTAAAVHHAYLCVTERLSEKQERQYLSVLRESLKIWHSNGDRAFSGILDMARDAKDAGLGQKAVAGLWVVIQVTGHEGSDLTDQDHKLAAHLTGYLDSATDQLHR